MATQSIAEKLVVSPAPHYHCGTRISKTMYTFAIALLPAVIFSVCNFGMHSVRVISVAIASAMLSEWIIQRLFKKPITISDGSALLTGLLFALIIPPSVPWWLVVVGCFVSILVGKQLYGGLGYSPLNPVLIGWAIIALSWRDYLNFNIAMVNYDLGYSYMYPLTLLKKSGVSAVSDFSYVDLLIGRQVGGLGAAPVLMVLIGGLFLLLRGIVSWRIPFFFILGTAITASIYWMSDSAKYADPLFHILTGNLMIGAFFLATDYSSSPVNKVGMALFGLGCGFFTVVFRAWSVYPDGVVFAILIMNILNPLLDKIRPEIPGKNKS